ncbi:T9SS type A sorting domain-containing protein [candidate division KSB1 bacterium]|nr:T9SS type A sorting domain-containing protein [candidate division KSB1 bacterium]
MNSLTLLITTVIFLPTWLFAQELTWQQEYHAYFNGKMTCAYSGGFNYAKPVLVDIDNDGDLDLFIGERVDGVDFYRNVGARNEAQWQLEQQNVFEVPNYDAYFAPVFCDIDADGDQDAFIGWWGGTVAYFQNIGSPTHPVWYLQTKAYLQFDGGYHSIPEFCDWDQDGDFDLTIACTDSVFMFTNTGDARQPNFVRINADYEANSRNVIRYYDFDADGDADRAVANWHGFFEFYKNNGNNQYALIDRSNILSLPSEDLFWGMAFGDLDDDHDLDLIAISTKNGAYYFENIGSVTNMKFIERDPDYMTIDIGFSSCPAFADLDNDGDLDISMGAYSQGIYKVINTGTNQSPEWTFTGEMLFGYGTTTPAFCDIDNDGDLDLFYGDYISTLYSCANSGTASNPQYITSDSIGHSNTIRLSPALCDIDHDGDYDLFTNWGKKGYLCFYQNIGSKTSPVWAKPDTSYGGIHTDEDPNAPTFCDIDHDGDFDLFIGTSSGSIFFYRNEGMPNAASFTLVTTNFGGIKAGWAVPVFADIDADGDHDLFVGEGDGGIRFFRNNGLSTAIAPNEKIPATPAAFTLEQNYPNPFNPVTYIRYQLTQSATVKLSIFNIRGQRIETLVNQRQAQGIHNVSWNAENKPAGVYYCRLQAGDQTRTRKLVLLK